MKKFIKTNIVYLSLIISMNIATILITFALANVTGHINLLKEIYFILLLVSLSTLLTMQRYKLAKLNKVDEITNTHNTSLAEDRIISLNTLVSGVAHELNTPLGISLTAMSYINDEISGLKKQDVKKDILPMVNLSISNLEKSINLLERFKELTSNHNISNYSEIYLEDLIHLSCSKLDPIIGNNKMIELKLSIQKNLLLKISDSTISTVINNIIENAYEFAFTEGNEGLIIVKGYSIGSDLIIEITDNGQGIPEDIAKHVFDPFFTTKRSNKHCGLGLSIAYNLIYNNYKGKIVCKSILGVETTFTITMPQTISNKIKSKVTTCG